MTASIPRHAVASIETAARRVICIISEDVRKIYGGNPSDKFPNNRSGAAREAGQFAKSGAEVYVKT